MHEPSEDNSGMSPVRNRIYAISSCGDCIRAKSFLKERKVSYEEMNIEETPGAAEFVIRANGAKRRVPTLDLDGRILQCSPFDPEKSQRN